MNEKHYTIRQSNNVRIGKWPNGYIGVSGRYTKRMANKKVRRTSGKLDGGQYKKVYGPFEWS